MFSPNFLGKPKAPSRLRALDIPRRFGKGLGSRRQRGNDGQRWATAQRHKPWGARPRLAIGDGGELHADGEVARDLRRKSYGNPMENPIGIAKYPLVMSK